MTTYIIKRLLLMFVTMFGICLISFVIINLSPGDPADQSMAPGGGGAGAESQAISEKVIRKNRERMFLDKPILFNPAPANRERKAVVLLGDLLDENPYTVSSALKYDVGDYGMVAMPAVIEALAQGPILDHSTLRKQLKRVEGSGKGGPVKLELDKTQRKNLLKALGQITQVLEVPPGDPRRKGDPKSRAKAWVDWWKANKSRFTEAAVRKTVQAWDQADPENREAYRERYAAVRQLGHFAMPALMELYQSRAEGSPERKKVAGLMANVASKPWDCTVDPDPYNPDHWERKTTDKSKRENYEADWENLVASVIADFRRRLATAELTKVPTFDDTIAGFTKGQIEARLKQAASTAEGPPEARKRVDRAVVLLGRKLASMKTREAFVKEQVEKKLKADRRGWKNYWNRFGENFLTYSAGESFGRMFTDTRFGHWFGNLVRLDFGESYTYNRPVMELISERFYVTFVMNFSSIFLTYLIAIPIGIFSATNQYSLSDRISTVALFILYSLPTFWVGTMMIWLLTGPPYLDLFPSANAASPNADEMSQLGRFLDQAWHLTLPVICLTYSGIAYISRQMRAGMLETIRQDYIRTARAKGLAESKVVFKHALRNSLIPIITLIANLLPLMIGGSVIIEQIFSIEGLGKLSFEAVLNRDYPLLMAIFTLSGVLTLLGILLSDILYALVDPRISYN